MRVSAESKGTPVFPGPSGSSSAAVQVAPEAPSASFALLPSSLGWWSRLYTGAPSHLDSLPTHRVTAQADPPGLSFCASSSRKQSIPALRAGPTQSPWVLPLATPCLFTSLTPSETGGSSGRGSPSLIHSWPRAEAQRVSAEWEERGRKGKGKEGREGGWRRTPNRDVSEPAPHLRLIAPSVVGLK